MKQVKRFIIYNFQCHPKTVIEPAPSGLTVITGPTDQGKSALVRAIKWLFQNRPLGDDYIRHFQNECKVTAEMADGTTVTRRRTASLNQYYVNDELYEGFGNGVPIEVQQALGVYSYDVAGETLNLNIAEQLAGPFLGSSITAPTRAKILGKLAGTEAIDRANKELGTDIYRAGQAKKELKADIKEKDKKIEKYNWVPVLGEKLEKAENKFEQIKQDQERLRVLKDIRDKLHDLKKKRKLINSKLFMLSRLEQAQFKIETAEQDIQFYNTLKTYADKWIELTNQRAVIEENSFYLRDVEKVTKLIADTTENVKKFNNLDDLKAGLDDVNNSKNELSFKLTKLQQVHKANEVIKSAIINLQRMGQLDKINDGLCRLQIKSKEINSRLDQVKIVDHVKKVISSIETNQNELSAYQAQLISIKHINKNIEQYQEVKKEKKIKIKQVKQIAEQSKKEYKKLLAEMGVCPTCGADMKETKLERVI